jgi:hypothetical protein
MRGRPCEAGMVHHLRPRIKGKARRASATPIDSLVRHLRAYLEDIQVLLVVRAAVDLQHVDVVGHEADVGVWIPVEPGGDVALAATRDAVVVQINLAVADTEFPGTQRL